MGKRFIIPVALLVLTAGCANRSSAPETSSRGSKSDRANVAAIEQALREDLETGNAKSIAEQCRMMEAITTNQCPREFRLAYMKHCQAWRAKEIQSRSNSASVIEGAVKVAANAAKGELDGGLQRMEAAQQEKDQAIADTWYDVERVAIEYGAKIPKK